MENGIWTIFHRSGEYSAGYTPFWSKFVCCGGTAQILRRTDGGGNGKSRITLRLAERFVRLMDMTDRILALSEAEISPGDLLMPGDASAPEDGAHWRITSVAQETGSGMVSGLVITAE